MEPSLPEIKKEIVALLKKLGRNPAEYLEKLRPLYINESTGEPRGLTYKEWEDVKQSLELDFKYIGGYSFQEWLNSKKRKYGTREN